MAIDTGEWNEYRRLVLKGLETLDEDLRALRNQVHNTDRRLSEQIAAMDKSLTELNTKVKTNAAVIGGAVGLVVALGVQLFATFVGG